MGRGKYTRKEIEKAEKLLNISIVVTLCLAILLVFVFSEFVEDYMGDGPIMEFVYNLSEFAMCALLAAPIILYVLGLIIGSFIGIDIGPKTRK